MAEHVNKADRFNPILIHGDSIHAINAWYKMEKMVTVAPFDPIPHVEFDHRATQTADLDDIWYYLQRPYEQSQAWDDKTQTWDLIRQERARKQIEEIYRGIVPATRADRTDMMALTALRADAILQADPSIIDKDFIVEAISYNPQVYSLLSQEAQQDQEILNAFFESYYNGNSVEHPVFKEFGAIRYDAFVDYEAPPEKLFTADNYEKIFEQVYTNQGEYSAVFDVKLKFLADARTWAAQDPLLIQELDNREKNVAERCLQTVAELAQSPDGAIIRRNMHEFGEARGMTFAINGWEKQEVVNNELLAMRKQVENMGNDTQKMIDAMYAVGEAIEFHGIEAVSKFVDVDTFYKQIGAKAAELEVERVVQNKPELSRPIAELKSEISWDKQWKHVGKNICEGHDAYLKDHPEVTMNKSGQVVLAQSVERAEPPKPDFSTPQPHDPSVLILKREGAFAHFNPMAMTAEQIVTIGAAQAAHERNYVPLKALEIGPPPQDHTQITDIQLAAEALRNARGDKEVAEVLSRLGDKIRDNSDHMIELMKINPQAYNATSPFVRKLEPFFKARAVEAAPRVYDFLSEKEQKKFSITFAYREGIMADVSYLSKMQKVLQQTPGKENNIYVPLYDKHPNCPVGDFYGGYDHQKAYEKMLRNRDAILDVSMLGQKAPISPLYFEGPRDSQQGLENGEKVRNIIVPDKGLILGPANIALCASHIENPYKNLTRLENERRALDLASIDIMGGRIYGPILGAIPEMPMLHDLTKEGQQWRREISEAFETKSPHKIEAKTITHMLNHCEQQAKIKICKDIRRDLQVPERPQRRLDFAYNDAVAVEVYPVKPRDMVRAMVAAGPELFSKYVSPQMQSDYWQVWSQEITAEKIVQSQSVYGVHPRTELDSKLLDQLCKDFPHIAPDIQAGRTAAERNVASYQQQFSHREAQRNYGFFLGEEALPTSTGKTPSNDGMNRSFDEGRSL